jgi:DNA-binding transcriptional regulator YiaG
MDESIDSPEAIMEMRKRHLRLALEIQQLAAQGLAELRERGELTAEECAELLAVGMALERDAKPH